MFCPCIVVLCVYAHQFLADRCRKKTLLYCLKCVSLSSLSTSSNRQEQHDVSLDLNLKKKKKSLPHLTGNVTGAFTGHLSLLHVEHCLQCFGRSVKVYFSGGTRIYMSPSGGVFIHG